MCQLKKKLAEENTKDNQGRTPLIEWSEVLLFHRETESLLKIPVPEGFNHFSTCFCPKTSSYQNSIFHPPSLIRTRFT
jgi:hypothetical protein